MPADPRQARRARRCSPPKRPSHSTSTSGSEPRDLVHPAADGDFLAEVRTNKFGTLTYARSGGNAEDVTLFDRARRRAIALYASPSMLAQRGPTYNEDELRNYDVVDYNIDTTVFPTASSSKARRS
jgi:hypothetical protein